MKTSRPSPSTFWSFWLPTVLILFLGLTLRLVENMRLPLFIDETLHLYRAHRGMVGELFFWNIRKWLYPVFLTLFQPGGPEGPWLARSLSAILGTLTIAGCVSLGRALDKPRVGLVAGLLYALLPLAVFHERQALADPLLTALVTLSAILSVWIARQARWWYSLILGLAMAAAYLTKISALPYLGLGLWAVLLLARPGRWWRSLAVTALALGIAVFIIGLTYGYVLRRGGVDTSAVEVTRDRLVELAIGEDGGENALPLTARLLDGLTLAGQVLPAYVGWGIVALVAVAGVTATRSEENRRATLFLVAPALLFALGPMAANRPLDATRYFEPNGPALVVLAAFGWESTSEWLKARRAASAARWACAALIALIVLRASWFDVLLITDPVRAPLTPLDRSQYFDNQPAGGAFAALSRDLVSLWRAGDSPHLDVLSTGTLRWITAYLGPRTGTYRGLAPDDPEQLVVLAGWLAQGDQVYVIEEANVRQVPEMPHGARLEFVASYADGFRTLRLFRVTGAQGALADAIVAQQTPDPALLEADYEALSASRASVGRWIVFPSNHANSLIGHLGMWVVPLQIGEWPFTQAVARQALSALDFSADGEVLGVVIVDEVNVDPQRLIASALQQRIYRATEAWHGVLHCMTYVTGPADPGFSPVHGRFEGGISVVEAAILDFQVQPGGAVRMALVWNTPVPIRDSFKVFVHVVDAGGNLRAQHDSIPGGGLLPMTIWQPRQNVVDRIAILLPVDLPPGEYEIRLGIYHPESGLRLPVLSAAEAGPDYVLLGRVTVAAQ